MTPQGRHLIIDYWQCDTSLLNDEDGLVTLLRRAAEAAGAREISSHSHRFGNQGVTAVTILAESHVAIHTWPESGYAGVDICTCGDCDPMLAHKVLEEGLNSAPAEPVMVSRGSIETPPSVAKDLDEGPLRSGLEDDKSWFIEGTVPGRRRGNVNHGFAVTNILVDSRTAFQDCLIFDNPLYGRVFALDGIIQLSTFDEHIYHEMLVHPAMFAHPDPERVVIVGGGDGGTLREVLRHNPKEVVMIDIDRELVELAAKYLPSVSAGAFEDPRVTLLFEDASEAIKRYDSEFDVAIIDCNDAIGPSEALFGAKFYASVSRALKDDGICALQAGSMLDEDFLVQTRQRMAAEFANVTGFRLTIPCYHCGEFVFLVASRGRDPSGPDVKSLTELQVARGIDSKYWSPSLHHASQLRPVRSTLW